MKKKNFTLNAIKIAILMVMILINGSIWAQDGKITICHCPPGNPGNCHSITISVNAWQAHFTHHDDYIGACTDNPNRKLVEVTAYPNPSYGQTTVTYVLLEESAVTIDVYNSQGLKIATIVNETQQPGTYTQSFTAPTAGLYLLSIMAVTPYEEVDNSQTVVESR
jgi:hypothetical protein